MMDWLLDFEKKFGRFDELQNIKQDKRHCSVEINFCDGIPQNYNYKLHRRIMAGVDDSINNFRAVEKP